MIPRKRLEKVVRRLAKGKNPETLSTAGLVMGAEEKIGKRLEIADDSFVRAILQDIMWQHVAGNIHKRP
jgi:hypothetical protein